MDGIKTWSARTENRRAWTLPPLREAALIAGKHDQIDQILRDLLLTPELLGATVVTRDGVCVLNTEKRILSPEAFSAMTAALMSAAETAFFHLGGARDVRVIAETDSTRLVALGASDELLLVVVARASADNQRIIPRIEESAGRIRNVLLEA